MSYWPQYSLIIPLKPNTHFFPHNKLLKNVAEHYGEIELFTKDRQKTYLYTLTGKYIIIKSNRFQKRPERDSTFFWYIYWIQKFDDYILFIIYDIDLQILKTNLQNIGMFFVWTKWGGGCAKLTLPP